MALYEVESEQGKDKGVISLAEVVETYKKSDFKENEKHSEVRWISREEVDTFKEDTVKDFKNTLKLMHEYCNVIIRLSIRMESKINLILLIAV